LKVKLLSGREVNLRLPPRKIVWDAKCRSIFQFNVKQFFKPFWLTHSVYEELRIPGNLLYIDLINFSKKIVVETSGKQHQEYNKHFHKGNPLNFVDQIKRDLNKEKWCEINNFRFIEIFPEDYENLSRKYIMEKFNIDIL
jgi:hypothetical protein